MAGYETGSEQLRQAARQMEDANVQLQSHLSALANDVAAVQGAWTGQAASAFQTLMEKFQGDAKQLNDSLQNISEQVVGSAQAYDRQEEEANQSVSAITQALGG